MNYFELFETDIQFNLDIPTIKKKYLSLQQKFHPDIAQNDAEKIDFIEKSMQLNEAYKTLLNDYLRATYIFDILGVSINEETSKNVLSPAELESIWDINEQLEQIDNLEDLYKLEKDKLSEQEELVSNLSKSFNNLLLEKEISKTIPDEKIETAIALTVKLKYLTNLVGYIRSKIKTLSSSL